MVIYFNAVMNGKTCYNCKIIIYKKPYAKDFLIPHMLPILIIWLFLSAFSDSVFIYTFWGMLPRLLSYLKHDPTSCKKEAFLQTASEKEEEGLRQTRLIFQCKKVNDVLIASKQLWYPPETERVSCMLSFINTSSLWLIHFTLHLHLDTFPYTCSFWYPLSCGHVFQFLLLYNCITRLDF